MNIVFTCGGTAGHINPAIAVADEWKKRHPEDRILFIGGKGHMEEELVPKAGYALKVLPAAGMSRKKTLKAVGHNLKAGYRAATSVHTCKRILKEFHADMVVGTGGYASFPALLAGKLMHKPTCVHEANAVPGLTTKTVAKWADRVLICFPESAKYYKNPEKAHLVGMPVKQEFIFTKKEDARKELGLDSRPLILSAFGSQGAKMMNLAMGKMFKLEQDEGFPYQHIHSIGSFGVEWMPDYVKDQGVDMDNANGLHMQKYIYNMPTVMAAADVIISRAGAASCNEIADSCTPCILIPSPNVTNNHQEMNARSLAEGGGAVMILEKDCTAEKIYAEVKKILDNPARGAQMAKALEKVAVPDSAERVCNIMEELLK